MDVRMYTRANPGWIEPGSGGVCHIKRKNKTAWASRNGAFEYGIGISTDEYCIRIGGVNCDCDVVPTLTLGGGGEENGRRKSAHNRESSAIETIDRAILPQSVDDAGAAFTGGQGYSPSSCEACENGPCRTIRTAVDAISGKSCVELLGGAGTRHNQIRDTAAGIAESRTGYLGPIRERCHSWATEYSAIRSGEEVSRDRIVGVDDDRGNTVLSQVGSLKGPCARGQMSDAYAKVCVIAKIELSGTDEHFIAARTTKAYRDGADGQRIRFAGSSEHGGRGCVVIQWCPVTTTVGR